MPSICSRKSSLLTLTEDPQRETYLMISGFRTQRSFLNSPALSKGHTHSNLKPVVAKLRVRCMLTSKNRHLTITQQMTERRSTRMRMANSTMVLLRWLITMSKERPLRGLGLLAPLMGSYHQLEEMLTLNSLINCLKISWPEEILLTTISTSSITSCKSTVRSNSKREQWAAESVSSTTNLRSARKSMMLRLPLLRSMDHSLMSK